MKRGIINIWLALAASATMMFVGCDNHEEATPVFPEKITATVEAGEEYEFTITANMAWTLEIPNEVAAFFKFIDGEIDRYELNGEAGTHTITVGVSNIEEFNTVRVCDISMTMGGETKVVATITRGGKERAFAMYVAENYTDEETGDILFSTDEDDNYIYSTTPAERLDWIWSNEQWMQRVVVDANFDWILSPETPAWLNINAIRGAAGRTELFLMIYREHLPLEDVTCNIEFVYSTNDTEGEFEVIGSYPTSMEGCKDVFEVDLTSAQFNAAGEYYLASSDDYVECANIHTYSPRGAELIVLNKGVDGTYTTEGADWILLVVDVLDDVDNEDGFPKEAGDYGVWKRTFSLRTTENTASTHREGAIAAIPVSAAGTTSYEEYIVCTITQKGVSNQSEQTSVIYAYDNDAFASYNSKFEELTSGTWPYMGAWTNIPNGYKMIYQTNNSEANVELVFNTPFTRYEIYGFNGANGKTYDLESCWLTLEPSEYVDNGYIVRSRLGETINDVTYTNTMAGNDGENEATIIFYDENDTAYALIYFILDPNYTTPIERPENGIAFADSTYEAAGATLKEVVNGDSDYSAEDAFNGTLQYRLTLNSNCKKVNLSLPQYLFSYGYQNWIRATDGFEKITIEVITSNLSNPADDGSYNGRVTIYGEGSSVMAQIIVIYRP